MATGRISTRQLLLHGIVGGIIAGVVFASAHSIMGHVLMGDAYGPIRRMGALALGPEAIDPEYPLAQAAIAGGLIYLVLSALYGVVFLYLVAAAGQLDAPVRSLLLYGLLFGVALWIINFLIIAPVAFPWFAAVDQFWFGFFAHALFYGTVLGAYMAAARPGLPVPYGP